MHIWFVDEEEYRNNTIDVIVDQLESLHATELSTGLTLSTKPRSLKVRLVDEAEGLVAGGIGSTLKTSIKVCWRLPLGVWYEVMDSLSSITSPGDDSLSE